MEMQNNLKTILIVTERFFPEEFRINDLVLAWKERGFNIKVLTQFPSYPAGKIFDGYKNALYKKELWQGIEIHRIFSITGYRESLGKKLLQYLIFMILGSFFALFVGSRCDAIFVYHLGPLTDAVPGILAKKLYKKPITIWTTDIWPDAVYAYGFKKTKLRELLLGIFIKFVYLNCRNILVSSPGFIGRINRYVPSRKVAYISYWADDAITSESIKELPVQLSTDNKMQVTFAGNIGKMQNLDKVIEGFGRSSVWDKMQLNIIGDGSSLASLKKLVEKNKYKSIKFWGRKKAVEMKGYYAASDALVISLVSNPFLELTIPGKFQTYLATAKPIFAIMNGPVRDWVQNETLGLACNPDNIEEIMEGFERLLATNREDLISWGNRCRCFCEREFNKGKIVESFLSFIFPSGAGQ
jgi:glycosyltransferase involved in cell wall biosynthesis